MADASDAPQRQEELLPQAAPRRQDVPPFRADPVVPSPALARLLDPAPLDPASALHAVEGRVEGGRVEPQRPLRPRLDELGDLVAVARPLFDQGEDQELRAALLELAV